MDATAQTGREPGVTGAPARWRIALSVAVLVGLAGAGVLMLPPYLDNFKLQQSLDELVARPETAALSEEILRTEVANRAARLGIPVRPSQVRIARGAEGIRVEVAYLVRVDFPFYTVDLHFRPSAAAR